MTTILISAGEASGDAHAALLAAAIRKRLPQADFLGIGGEALAGQGVNIIFSASRLAVVGLLEVAERLPDIWRALKAVHQALKKERPSLVILVDFPDFNFWVARLAKWHGVPVMYYISPQVWAWRSYRVRTIARLVDRMVVIFPFEAEFYRSKGVPVDFVGHPFQETLPSLPTREELLKGWGLDPTRLTLALLPGSRASEIERHLPLMLAGAEIIRRAIPEVQFLLPLASTAPVELVSSLVNVAGFCSDFATGSVGAGCKPAPTAAQPEQGELFGKAVRARLAVPKTRGQHSPGPPLKIIPGQAYAALSAAHLAIVASGTATVEAALAGCPAVIVYRLAPLTYKVGKRLIQVDYIGMANLLAREQLFPELIQDDFTPERLAQEALDLIRSPEHLAALRRGLARVVTCLGGPGASARAAEVAIRLLAEAGQSNIEPRTGND